MSILLPAAVNQTIDAVAQGSSTADLRRQALEAIEQGEELSEEQIAALSTVEVRELAEAQQQVAEERAADAADDATVDEFVVRREVKSEDGQQTEVFEGRGPTKELAYKTASQKWAQARQRRQVT